MLRARLRNGGRIFAHLLLLDLRPEAQQRPRAVEAHVETAVERVVETLHISEAVRLGGVVRTPALAGPERSTIGQEIKLVEQLGAIPRGSMLIVDDRLLPRIDGFAPLLLMFKGSARDLPRVRSFRSKKVRVMAVPLAPAAELHHRQIPTQGHGNHPALVRSKREAHRYRAREDVAARGYRLGKIGQTAILREGPPDLGTISPSVVSRKISDLGIRAGERCDGELAIPFLFDSARPETVEHNAARLPGADGLGHIAIDILLVERPVERAQVVSKPAHHVGPREENRYGDRLRGGILRCPAIYSDWIAGLPVVVGQDRRKLFERQPDGQRARSVCEPALGIKRSILAVAGRITPVPATQRSAHRLARGQRHRDRRTSVRLRE